MQNDVFKAQFSIFDASNYKVGIVVAQFNRDITDKLLGSAVAKLQEYKVEMNNISVHRVAGCVEIPVVLKAMAESKKFDCLVAIGAVVRGDTPHFDYVCKIVSEGVLRIMLDNKIAIGFSVLTVENKKQAEVRIHVGGEAAEAAMQTARVVKDIG